MSTLLRLVDRFRPKEGWPALFLTLAAVLCPAAALLEAREQTDPSWLLILPILAFCSALALARFKAKTWLTAMLGALLGCLLAVTAAGRLVPPPSLLWSELRYAAHWLKQWQRGIVSLPLPLTEVGDFIWQRLAELGTRLWWWGQAAVTGGVAQHPTAVWLMVAVLAWGLAFFTTWQVFRRHAALHGLFPGGTALAILAFFRGGLATFYLVSYLTCTLALSAACSLWAKRERWDKNGTDYPGGLGLDLAFALTPMLILLIAAGILAPVIHPHQIGRLLWGLMEEPWSAVERTSERLIGPMLQPKASQAGTGGARPRSHLLGSGAELAGELAFTVLTNDVPPPEPDEAAWDLNEVRPPRRYWRTVTYDIYTGQGWTNSPLQPRSVPPYEPLEAADEVTLAETYRRPRAFELQQRFELVAEEGMLLLAVNAPFQVDHATESWWRAPGDLAQVTSSARSYTVLSHPPDPTIEELRAAPGELPAAIAGRYLALPSAVPVRVLELAEEVAGEAETRYDQAHAIGLFLRTYTYTLELPPLPRNQDLVDYFLFDLQQGYCDYYASAMVVMARAVGVPARLATGYAQGSFDYGADRWIVTEADGHSWVEVYFHGIGWVEFEPTAGIAALNRPGGDAVPPEVPPLPRRSGSGSRLAWEILAFGASICLLAAAVLLIWWPHSRSGHSATDLVQDRHARLECWGQRLGQPLRDGQTANEYGTALAAALQIRGQRSRWALMRRAAAQATAGILGLTQIFVQAQYASNPITDQEALQIREQWSRLKRLLFCLWLLRH